MSLLALTVIAVLTPCIVSQSNHENCTSGITPTGALNSRRWPWPVSNEDQKNQPDWQDWPWKDQPTESQWPGDTNYKFFCTIKISLSIKRKYRDNRMTQNRCQWHCTRNAYQVAALEAGGTCACGFWKTKVSVQQQYCNTPCYGNAKHHCGGPPNFVTAATLS